MAETTEQDPDPPPSPPQGRRLIFLALASLGVVFGDIGTSPLYALKECFHGAHALGEATPANILGVLSLILWALILIISIKYVMFIMRADNHGEGGILALTALVAPGRTGAQARGEARQQGWLVVLLGLFGAALLYADGMITPAISVLSAVEGLNVIDPGLKGATPGENSNVVILITVAILVGLFLIQVRGTTGVGTVFGPVLLLWFMTLAGLGVAHIVHTPEVLLAINPRHAALFFAANGFAGFVILGTVFLAVTGGEALYADIGHFGARPIRLVWFAVVLPALVLNYFGQGALLLRLAGDEEVRSQPLFHMAPDWALVPLVVLATAAAVIASQALITGAFSLTLQAVQLGYAPRFGIRHTSEEQHGQIYVPAVNWALMASCIVLVLGFRSSTNLVAAYGVAISITMLTTTLLFSIFARSYWGWSLAAVALVCGTFLVIELAFLGANLLKVLDGGWFPLLVGGGVFTLLSTWRRGRQILAQRLRERFIPLDLFLAELLSSPPPRVPGTAVFMSGNPVGTPPALRHNVKHNHVLHETVVIACVQTVEIPHVPDAQRNEVEEVGEGFWRVLITYGFMDDPNVPHALAQVTQPVLRARLGGPLSYFLGRETLIPSEGQSGMWLWRERLFTWMSRNAHSATTFFRIPPEDVVEIGVQVEL